MTKYEPLRTHLLKIKSNEWRPTFSDIENILGFSLPKSARTYPAWWANDATQSRHSTIWVDAGWQTAELNLTAERVVFRRVRTSRSVRQPKRSRTKPKQIASIIRGRPENETRCALRLSWQPIGDVQLDASGNLLFPKVSTVGGLYRFLLRDGARQSSYIGEAVNLLRRFQHYRTPGATQPTNLRINKLMRETLSRGGSVSIALVVDTAWTTVQGKERRLVFSSKLERVFAEHAALLMGQTSSTESLNK